MRWRQQWEVDGALKQWTPPEVFTLYHPSGTSGFDKDGAPSKFSKKLSVVICLNKALLHF